MIPQGSIVFNSQVLTSLTQRINAAGTCAELQSLVDDGFGSLSAVKASINAELAVIAPILALLDAPTNPAAVITWVQNFITSFLTPYVKPYVNMALQLTQLAESIASLTAAIEAKAAQLTHCTIAIPEI